MTVSDNETLTVSTTALSLTQAKIEANVVRVDITSDGGVRYWTSGKNPTAAQGFPLDSGYPIKLSRQEAINFRVIRRGGTDVAVHAQYVTML